VFSADTLEKVHLYSSVIPASLSDVLVVFAAHVYTVAFNLDYDTINLLWFVH